MHFRFFDFHRAVEQHSLGEVGEVHNFTCAAHFEI